MIRFTQPIDRYFQERIFFLKSTGQRLAPVDVEGRVPRTVPRSRRASTNNPYPAPPEPKLKISDSRKQPALDEPSIFCAMVIPFRIETAPWPFPIG